MNKSSLTFYQDLLGQTNTAPLSQTMPIALRLARELKQTDFEKWLRLEIGGYFNTNSALTDDIKVPEYRNVAGQHLDKYGRPIAVSSKLQFVNSVPLRNGIDELENSCWKNWLVEQKCSLSKILYQLNFSEKHSTWKFLLFISAHWK